MNIMDTLKKPAVMVVLALFVGIFLGLVYGYLIDPVTWTDQPMTFTRPDLQQDYLRMAFDSLRVNGDMSRLIGRYHELHESGPAALDVITPEIDPATLQVFQQAVVDNPSPDQQSGSGDSGGNMVWTILIIVGSLVVVGLVGLALFWLFRNNTSRAPEDMTPAMQAAELSRSIEKTDYSTAGGEPPVAQYITTYVLGDDLFDDSFSIDAPSGEFLGECGVGISETVGVGDPKKVTAFEVWMFDKNDIQTVTKVLMSASAFNDPSIRAKLEAKGELVQLEPQKQIVLETQTLQMIATISDMQYGQSTMPNGSYFDRLTMELAIWSKK